jgi:hypothetical protein
MLGLSNASTISLQRLSRQSILIDDLEPIDSNSSRFR